MRMERVEMSDIWQMTDLKLSERPRLAQNAQLQWDSGRQKYIMVAPETLAVLNDTAFSVLILCNGLQTVEEIIEQLNRQYHTDVTKDVLVLLNRLVEKRLVALCQMSGSAQAGAV